MTSLSSFRWSLAFEPDIDSELESQTSRGRVVEAEICGDVPLSAGDRLRYLWRNACRNISMLGQGPKTRCFRPDLRRVRNAAAGQSPGRLSTELFLEAQLPALLPPRPVDVIEIGCGTGTMAYRLARFGFGGRYTGVDIQDRFRHDHPPGFPFEIEYQMIDVHAFAPKWPVDLLISNSTLEHIARDGEAIARLSQFFSPGSIELHVVPSGPSLATYLWHGYRQYTPAALAARFGRDIEIVRIGGFGGFMLHILFITVPELIVRRSLRKAMPGFYGVLLRVALRIDRLLPIFPTAYAVIRRH